MICVNCTESHADIASDAGTASTMSAACPTISSASSALLNTSASPQLVGENSMITGTQSINTQCAVSKANWFANRLPLSVPISVAGNTEYCASNVRTSHNSFSASVAPAMASAAANCASAASIAGPSAASVPDCQPSSILLSTRLSKCVAAELSAAMIDCFCNAAASCASEKYA